MFNFWKYVDLHRARDMHSYRNADHGTKRIGHIRCCTSDSTLGDLIWFTFDNLWNWKCTGIWNVLDQHRPSCHKWGKPQCHRKD